MAFTLSSSSSVNAEEWLNCEVCGLTFKNEKHYSIHCGGTFHANRVAASLRASQNPTKTTVDPQSYAGSTNPSYWTGLQQSFPDIQQMEPQDKTHRTQGQPGTAAYQSQREYVSYPVGKRANPAGGNTGDGYEMEGFGWSDARSGPSLDADQSYFGDRQSESRQPNKGSSRALERDPWENSYYSTADEARYPGQGFANTKKPQEPSAKTSRQSDVPTWYKMIEPAVSNAQKKELYKPSSKPSAYGNDGQQYGCVNERPVEQRANNSSGSSMDISGKLRQLRGESGGKNKGPVNRSAWGTDDYAAGSGGGYGGRFGESDSRRNNDYYDGRGGSDSRERDEFDHMDASLRDESHDDCYRMESSYYRDHLGRRIESFSARFLEKPRDESGLSKAQSVSVDKRETSAQSGRCDDISSRAEPGRKIQQLQQNKGMSVKSDWNGGGVGGGDGRHGKMDTGAGTSQRNVDAALGFAAAPSRNPNLNNPQNTQNSSSSMGPRSVGSRPDQVHQQVSMGGLTSTGNMASAKISSRQQNVATAVLPSGKDGLQSDILKGIQGQLNVGKNDRGRNVNSGEVSGKTIRGMFQGVRSASETSRQSNPGVGVGGSSGILPVAPKTSQQIPGASGFAGVGQAGRGVPRMSVQGGRGISGVQNFGSAPGMNRTSEGFPPATVLGRVAVVRPRSTLQSLTRPLVGEQKGPAYSDQGQGPPKSLGASELPGAALGQKSNRQPIRSLFDVNFSSVSAGTAKGELQKVPLDNAANQKNDGWMKPQLGSKSESNTNAVGRLPEKSPVTAVEKPLVKTTDFIRDSSGSQAGNVLTQVPARSVTGATGKLSHTPVKTTASVGQIVCTNAAAKTSNSPQNKPSSDGFVKPATVTTPTTTVTSLTTQTGKTVPSCPGQPQPTSILSKWASEMMAKSAASSAAKPIVSSGKAALLPTPSSGPVIMTQASGTGRKTLLPTPKLIDIPPRCDPSSSRITIRGSGYGKVDGGKSMTKTLPLVKSSVVASEVKGTRSLINPVCSTSKLESKVTAAASSVSNIKAETVKSTKDLPTTPTVAGTRPMPLTVKPTPLIPVPGVQGGGGGGGERKEVAENVDEFDPGLSEALGQFFHADGTAAKSVKSLNSTKVSSSEPAAEKPDVAGAGDYKKSSYEPLKELSGLKTSNESVKSDSDVMSKPDSKPPETGAMEAKQLEDVSTSKSRLTVKSELEDKRGKDKRTDSDHDPISELSRYLPPEIMKEITSGQPPKELLEKVAELLPADVLLRAVEFLKNCSAVKDVRAPTAESSREASRSRSGGGSGARIQVVAPRKGLDSHGSSMAVGKQKYNINISKLKDMSFEEMLQLFQELLQDILGSLFEEEQKLSLVEENKILDGLSADDRDLALSVRRTTGISDISKIVHTLNILKALDSHTILALGQLDQSIVASSLSGNERAQTMGVTVLQQITNLIAKENSLEKNMRNISNSADEARHLSSSTKSSGVQSLLSLDFLDPTVASKSPGPTGIVRPDNCGRGLLPTPVLPPQNSNLFSGQNLGPGLLPIPPIHDAIGNFPMALAAKRKMPSSETFFNSGPEPKRWR